MLEANQLRLFKGSKVPASDTETPKTQMLLDGLIIDDSEKKDDSVFIVKSLFANSTGDMLIHFKDAKTAKVWKERLQAASFFHNMPREKQLAGLAAGKPKAGAAPERKVDEYGNRLSVAAPKGMPVHDLPPMHVERERSRAAPAGNDGAGVAAAAGAGRGAAAGKSAGGGGQGAGKAAAHFRGPLKSFTIIGMEVRNASTTFDDPFLAVGIFGTGGARLAPLVASAYPPI